MSFAAATFSAGASLRPQVLRLSEPDNGVPNNRLPLIVYPQAVPAESVDFRRGFTETFQQHGWPAGEYGTIHGWTHFRLNCHEALGVACGWCEVLFGGDNGRVIALHAGDAVLIPAGVGRKQLHASEDCLVVGAFSGTLRVHTGEGDPRQLAAAQSRVARVHLSKTDPLTGVQGAMQDFWMLH
ncbi:hypothetical protein [Pantoea sp. 1.19]|uniref:hypothetical protein n=1 Tax=Pantoea sp. 1.19 TaxID=1925589 RepID=UPI000948D634|nr:hypothetical protein [Pantoea sp. 1.19]